MKPDIYHLIKDAMHEPPTTAYLAQELARKVERLGEQLNQAEQLLDTIYPKEEIKDDTDRSMEIVQES